VSHSPEPWFFEPYLPNEERAEIHCGERTTHPTDDYVTSPVVVALKVLPTIADAERIVAAVNFCRQFDTEFLQSHQMFKVSKGEDGELVAKSLADIPGFYGLVAVAMIPVVREPVSAGR
jgi:hypothetical protein